MFGIGIIGHIGLFFNNLKMVELREQCIQTIVIRQCLNCIICMALDNVIQYNSIFIQVALSILDSVGWWYISTNPLST